MASVDFAPLLEPVRAAAREIPREELPALCGALATLQAEILLPPPAAPPTPDRQLTLKQAAAVIGRSPDRVSRHRAELPRTLLSSGRWAVSERKLRAWLERRSQ